MEETIDCALELLGLKKNERKLYLDVIKNGKSTVLEITKRTEIHRTNVYDALRKLGEKGFVQESLEEGKKFFIARDPEKINDYFLEIKGQIEAAIPHIKFIAHKESEAESIIMSKGTLAIRDALSSLLDLNAPINVYGATKEAPDSFGVGYLNDFHKKRIAKKRVMRHIYHYDAPERIIQLNKLTYTEARHLPKKYYAAVSTAICGDTVIFFIFTHPVSLIKIKNKRIADSYTQYFEILWSKARSS